MRGGERGVQGTWDTWISSRLESLTQNNVLRSLRPVEPSSGDEASSDVNAIPTSSSTSVFVAEATMRAWRSDRHDLGGSTDNSVVRVARTQMGGSVPSTSYTQTHGNEPTSSSQKLTLFSSNDYLGLGSHEKVCQAASNAAIQYGAGPRSSPLICGYTKLHRELEVQLARLKHTEECLLFPTGFAVNTGIIPSLCDSSNCEIFSDELNHASIVDGCKLAKLKGVTVTTYRHCNIRDLERVLRKSNKKRKLIITDSLFSVDGDWAPLQEIVNLKRKYKNVLVMIDEAHSTLVCGETGAGACEMFGVDGLLEQETGAAVDVHVGTLSKAFGSHGGFACCSANVKSILVSTSRSQIFSTSLPAPLVAAALASLHIASGSDDGRNEGHMLRAKLWRHVERLNQVLCGSNNSGRTPKLIGKGTCSAIVSPIFVITFGDEWKALAASRELLTRGIHAPAIRPPTVPKGTSRVRIALSAAHSDEDIALLIEALTMREARFGRVSDPARGVVYRTRLRKQVTHRNVKAFSEGSSDLSKMQGVDQSTRLDSSASKVISTEVKHETRWLQFRHLTYTDPSGAQRGWDMVGRSTTTETGVADAVCVFATLKKKGQPDDILLVRQFRPPMNGETIELPAGLMDANESAETTALRELEEETGYIGTVSDNSTTPALPLSPGLSNETVALVKVTVDLDLDVNKNPKQKLEGSEFITVLRVQKKGLKAELDALIKKGYHVFAGLYTLAMGMEMSEE